MASGGGGETETSSEPWKGQKIALNNLYNRADTVTQGDLTPYGSMGMGDRRQQQAQLWGTQDTGAVGKAYGMTPAQLDVMNRTGVAPLNADQNAANAMVRKAAGTPLSSLYGQASQTIGNQMKDPYAAAGRNTESYLTDAASGKYLTPDSNPYAKGMYDAATRQSVEQFNNSVLPGLTAQFSNSGRYGSGQQQAVQGQAAEDMQRNLQDTAANMYGSIYESERGRQQAAAGMLGQYADARATQQQRAAALAPSTAMAPVQQQAYQAGLLGNVGNQTQAMQQNLYGNLAGNYMAGQQAPYNQLQQYSSVINGTPSFQNMTQSGADQGGFSATGAAGGAMSGAAMGTAIMPGWGTAIGAVGGGLAGGFF